MIDCSKVKVSYFSFFLLFHSTYHDAWLAIHFTDWPSSSLLTMIVWLFDCLAIHFFKPGVSRLRSQQEILFPLPERNHLRPGRLCLQLVVQCRLFFIGQLLQSQRSNRRCSTVICQFIASAATRAGRQAHQTGLRPTASIRRPVAVDN